MTGNELAPCFMAAYLIKAHSYKVQDALKHIRRQRPQVKPQPALIEQLHNYQLIVGAQNKRFQTKKAMRPIRELQQYKKHLMKKIQCYQSDVTLPIERLANIGLLQPIKKRQRARNQSAVAVASAGKPRVLS